MRERYAVRRLFIGRKEADLRPGWRLIDSHMGGTKDQPGSGESQ